MAFANPFEQNIFSVLLSQTDLQPLVFIPLDESE
jgi:hypothetical protein